MPPQERLWLNDEKYLLPGPNHPCQKHQQESIRFGAGWSFHLSAQDDKLLTEKCVFCHEFGPALGKVTTVPNMREELDGLVQSTKRCWSDWRHMLVICLMKIRRPGTVYDSFLFEDE